MEYIWILIGALVSSAVANIIFFVRYRNVGTLRIDHSDPDKDVYRFEISNLDNLSKRKRIVLDVDNKADLSQK
jgi:hypothetical protein